MATKMKSTLLTMSLVLLLIASVSSALLAYVYKLTKEPIELANKKKKIEALSQVLPEFDNSPIDESFKIAAGENEDSLVCYPGTKNGQVVGIAIESYTDKGFSGHFTVMIGFEPDGTIYNTMMLEHHETPGLGDKADKEKSDWSNQFNGKNPAEGYKLQVTKDGGDVDAITAATITSRAYTDAVERAYNAFISQIKDTLNN
jgi:electron transport complex protein RnfG